MSRSSKNFLPVFLLGVTATVSAAPLNHVEDFESGRMSFGSFYSDSGNAPVVSTDVARNGKYSMKSILNRKQSNVSFRTELTFSSVKGGFEEQWYGFSIYLPDSYKPSEIWELVAQWHDVPDDWSMGRQNPPMLLSTTRGEWSLTNIWDTDRVGADGSFEIDGRKSWKFGNYQTGRWTDWVFRIRWAYNSEGYMQVWKDGEMVVDTTGPNTYNDKVAPYMKLGIYKGWKDRSDPVDTIPERVLYHDDIKISGPGATYESVAPGVGYTPPEPPSISFD